MENSDNQAPAEGVAIPTQVGNPPGPYWTQVVNSPPGMTQIVVPQAGNLWVYFAFQDVPPQQIGVWHQGGAVTPIQPGENFVPVGSGDMLYYQLANPAADSIKLAFQIG